MLPARIEESEQPLALWFQDRQILSPKGPVGMLLYSDDTNAAIQVCRAHRVFTLATPHLKINSFAGIVMVSRKPPWQGREREFVQEAADAGIWQEFYRNPRGRFMRINDAYQHRVYQLQRAYFVSLPLDFPDQTPDVDLGWLIDIPGNYTPNPYNVPRRSPNNPPWPHNR